MARSDDEYDSDDSGFGFDDGLSTDAALLGRIAKMRGMMNLAGDSGDAAPPATNDTNPAANTNTTPPAVPTPTVRTVPTAPARANNTNPTDASDEEADKIATATAETTALDEDEFLLVDRVTALSLSQHREQSLQAARASSDVLSGPRQGDPSPPEDADEEGEVGAEDEEEDEEEEDDEEDEDDGYVVTWARGQLGLLFKAGARGETVIRRINKKSSGADGLHLARVGDVLVAVNGESVRARAFQEIVEQLRLPTFPVTLSFQPLKLSDDDDDEDGEGDVAAATRTSEHDREMERKQSSVSAISSSSSTSASFSVGNHANGHGGGGASSAHRLNQLASGLPPPPSYAAANGPASLSRSQSLEDPLGPGEYDVVWQHGSLGCGIKQRNGLPTIKSVTPGAAVDVSVQQIEQDDVMIRINGIDTDAIGFRAVVEMMRVAPKPLYMRFRRAGQAAFRPPAPHSHGPSLPRPSSRYENKMDEILRDTRVTDEDILAGSLTPSQYTVLWNEGPLGVQIKPRPSDGAIVVTKFTGTGNPELLSTISIGDVFVRIAGLNVADMGIVGTCEKLKTVHKPVVLVFERSSYPVHRSHRIPRNESHFPPAPPSPSPAPTRRKGFAAVDMDNTTVVPSFRELREREAAAANEGRNRGSFGGFSAHERGDGVFGAADRRAVLAGQRPASYDTIDGRDFGQVGVHHAGGDVRYQDRASDPSNDSSGRWGGAIGTDGTDLLPRFSDIENGRVNTTTVTTLPPPPAYHDTFTPSGRFLDPNQFEDAQQPPHSPHSDGRQGSSVSSGQGPQHGAPPPGYNNHAYGYTQPTLPPGARQPLPYSAPAPPAYGAYSGHHQHYNGGGGAFGGSSRADNLRLEYMRQQRELNRPVAPPNRDIAMTELSTYTDLDDSGIMAAMARPANRMRMQGSRQPLPTPELWIQWTEGPLGITFRRTNGQIVVSRLTGAGYSRGIEQLRAGDWLVSIGNRGVGTYMTSELKLAQTMELIKKLPKPVDMRFVVR